MAALNRAKLLETADKLVRQGKIDEAIRNYMALSEDNPRDVNTINRIGDLYVRLRKNKEAIRQFMRIADFYAGDGFHLKAIAMYKKITKLDPSHADANERLADLYAKQGLVIEARTQFLSLAEQCLKAGQKPRAIEIYQKVQALEPENLKVKVILADLQGKEGDPAKAADGFLSAAASLKDRGMPEEALKILLKAFRLQPARAEVQAEIVAVLRGSGKQPSELTATLEQLRQAIPGNGALLAMLGENYLAMGRTADFQKLQKGEKSIEGRVSLIEAEARHLQARGDPAAAVACLNSAVEAALRDLGPARAAALLEQALEFRPDDVEALERLLEVWTTASNREGMRSAIERLARLLCQKQDWEHAARVLDRLRETAPGDPAIGELSPLIDARRGIGASRRPEAASPADVPTLDELEKVVELDSGHAADTLGENGEEAADGSVEADASGASDGSGSGIPPALELDTMELDESDLPEAEEILPLADEEGVGGEEDSSAASEAGGDQDLRDEDDSREGDVAEEQDTAYAGKSVIQEMREEPEKSQVDEDFLSEHFTEAEVFLKYGLAEKAREQLQTILGRYPDHIPSLKKMKEILSEDGKKGEAAALLMNIAEIHRSRGEEEAARDMEEQARELDPAASRTGTARPGDSIAAAPAPKAEEKVVTLDSALDLELPDSPRESPAGASPPVLRAGKNTSSRASAPPSSPSAEGEEFVIDLIEEGPVGARNEGSTGGFDPEKASQFDFYLGQRLLEEAGEVLSALERGAPGHPGVVERRARFQELQPGPSTPVADLSGGDLDLDVERAFGAGPAAGVPEPQTDSPPPGEDGFFDLAAELKAQVLENPAESEGHDPSPGISSGEEASIDEIFKAFRKKVDQQVEEEDYETRYNLGIAYKEMGLLDEAIGEFQYASREPKLFLECCSILGICFREKGMADLSIKWYRKALESTGHSEDKYQGLRYDLGDLYAEKGDYKQALSFFSEVYGVNSNYRDVASRIRELRKRIG